MIPTSDISWMPPVMSLIPDSRVRNFIVSLTIDLHSLHIPLNIYDFVLKKVIHISHNIKANITKSPSRRPNFASVITLTLFS